MGGMNRPGDYQILVPDGWFRISLEPGDRGKAVAALAERQFRGMDNVPHLKKDARRSLTRAAEVAFAGGGIEMYVSLQAAARIPLSATLIVSLTPPHDDPAVAVTPDRLARALAGPDREVTITDLHAGPAVRVLRQGTLRSGTNAPPEEPSTCLDVHVPVPGSSSFLILSFSTPLTVLAVPMTGLFDAIVGTLRWIP
jgi:hypothetical protein